MSSERPILILQMQRMGDLVLSYPLCGWLASALPDTPIWLVGEKLFFTGLIDISPAVTYFDYSAAPQLKRRQYSLVINLSHRPEAAELAGSLSCERRVGPYMAQGRNDTPLFIEGGWQLYRSSIIKNNRHNLFHWADLNALDLIPLRQMRRTNWPQAESLAGSEKRIGLFVGASEPDKRPDPPFWAFLAEKLLERGYHPVFLGGQSDYALGARAAALLKAPSLNLCGKFSIRSLCLFMKDLSLLAVPDTGPMHIATWLGVPVLNLSLGPVNAWETGPFAPGQHVLRRRLSCTGCWQCSQSEVWCKNKFSPTRTAEVIVHLLENKKQHVENAAPGPILPGYELLRTRRDENGLFDLLPLTGEISPRLARSRFWQYFFLLALEKLPQDGPGLARLTELAQHLRQTEKLDEKILQQGRLLLLNFSKALRTRNFAEISHDNHWQNYLPFLHPLSSFLQLELQNSRSASSQPGQQPGGPAVQKCIGMVELFLSLFK